jgi:serine phosphatase RsbU (regulator of sigma subunit)/CBS domain-containing protein
MAQESLTVRQVMQGEVVTVAPDCPLDVVLGLMNLHRIGAIVVVREDRSLAGIFTERDLLRRVAVAEDNWRARPVSEWMTLNPHTIDPDIGWEAAMQAMERLRVRHLPVIESGRVIGIISPRLLVAHRADHLNRMVEERTRELRLANEDLLARDAELRYNLQAAGRFQNRLLLPHAPPDWPELRWGVHYAPLDHLGGDYYAIAQPDADHLGLLIADASGHSIAAGMVAILSRIAFSQVAERTTSPGEVLAAMNRRLQGLADERFVTAFYGVLNRKTRTLTYSSAGHPHPYRFSTRSGEVQPLSAQGFLLGIMPDEVYREREIVLEKGDRLCFYTDGLIEARNEIGETFGTQRLQQCLTAHGIEPAERLSAHLLSHLTEFRGSISLADDVTLVIGELVE